MKPELLSILLRIYVDQPEAPWKEKNDLGELYELQEMGLTRVHNGNIETHVLTEKGKAHVAQLCAIKQPVPLWVDAEARVINTDQIGES